MTLQVTYNGKPGKAEEETLPVPPIPQPFHTGETRVFTDNYLRSLGVDPKVGDQWVKDTFAIQNQNRNDDDLLFVVAKAPDKPSGEKSDKSSGAKSGSSKE